MDVQDVEPDDGIFSWIVMIVPRPVRRQHEIARFHHHLLAFDVGVPRSVAFYDEAECGGGMAVALRALSRLDELDRHLERPAGGLLLRQSRVYELHRPSLGGVVDAAELNDLAG